jgi:alkylation response protein AidB-like acyl-CoA dehydrogenase
MDHHFTRQQEALYEKTRAFVKQEIPDETAVAIETADVFPHNLMTKLAEHGFFGINVPTTYGGQDGTVVEEMIFFEEISKALPVLAWTAGDVLLYGNNIIKTNGNEAQKMAYLPRLVQGKMLFCFALTEPDAGSDAASIQTAAEPIDGNWVINGNKMFISGASVADIAVTNTRTAPSKYGGITSFLVDTRSQGYKASPLKKLGYKGSDTCEVVYDAVTVTEDQILGGPECLNQGWQQMMRLLNGERLVLSACALGIAERVLSHLVPFVRERSAAARPAGRYQDLEHKVVELATEVEAARRLAYYAAWMVTEDKPCVRETSMTKYFCAEVAKKVAVTAMQIMGNQAWALRSSVQRFFRDVPVLSVGGGTSQIQKNIIFKTLGFAG